VKLKRLEASGTNWVERLRSKLSVKLFLGSFLFLVVLFWTSFGVARTLIPELYTRQFTTRFEQFVADFGAQIIDLPLEEIIFEIERFAAYNNSHVTLINETTDEIIYISNAMTVLDENSPLIEARSVFRRDPFSGSQFAISAQTHLDSIFQINEILEMIFNYLLMGNLIISLLASYLLSMSISKPIVSLSKKAKNLEQLRLDEDFKIARSDEIGLLAKHLNSMAEKLDLTIKNLHNANEQLRLDINLKQEQEKQRTQLFTALSHDLKTPLVVIKGELEGMIKNIGAYKDRDKYLKNVYQTAGSMEKLIQQILMVSQFETKDIELTLEPVDLTNIVNTVCQNHESLASLRNVSFLFYAEDDIISVVDKYQISIVISNIVSNAIFHSSVHDIVWVNLERVGNYASLTVKNKGHLKESELKQIFEPFFRLDKSRNRHSGGSGLGLYLVKSILDLHKFSFTFENDQDNVVFSIKFPLKKEG